jgi:hypothetical protein
VQAQALVVQANLKAMVVQAQERVQAQALVVQVQAQAQAQARPLALLTLALQPLARAVRDMPPCPCFLGTYLLAAWAAERSLPFAAVAAVGIVAAASLVAAAVAAAGTAAGTAAGAVVVASLVVAVAVVVVVAAAACPHKSPEPHPWTCGPSGAARDPSPPWDLQHFVPASVQVQVSAQVRVQAQQHAARLASAQ